MRKVLVIGAGGTIGYCLVKALLREGNFEITLLDLKTKEVMERLKKYKRRVNIIYGDVLDRCLIEALVKDHDYVVYLASPTPLLSNLKNNLAMMIDYGGCEIVVRAINYYNPKCHLFYASTTSIYKTLNPHVGSKISASNYFEEAKIAAEKLIRSKLKNYTIYRLPLVLSNPVKDTFYYHGVCSENMDFITKEDCAYAFVKGIKSKEVNRSTFNLGSGEVLNYGNLLNKILDICGINLKYIITRTLISNEFLSPCCSDIDELDNILKYQNDTLNDYYKKLQKEVRGKKINKTLTKFYKRKNL